MTGIGLDPDLQTADPISWDEDPRLFPHPLRSRDAPGGHSCPSPNPNPAGTTFPWQTQPGSCSRDSIESWELFPSCSSLSMPFPTWMCGKSGSKVPLVSPQPPPAPAQGPQSSFGDKDTAAPRGGNTYIGSGYLLLFPKGKHRGEKDRRLVQEQPRSQHGQKTNPGSFCLETRHRNPFPSSCEGENPVVERKSQLWRRKSR